MDFLGYILIIGALVGAGVLLVLSFRQKSDQQAEFLSASGSYASSMPSTPPSCPIEPAPVVTPKPTVHSVPSALPVSSAPAEPAPAEAGKDQHTIYAFAREAQVCICPCCDGENNIYREKCSICGFEFRRGGWGR